MPRPTKTASSRARGAGDRFYARLAWLALAAVWAFVALALVSYDPADPPGHAASPLNHPAANWCGPVGAFVAHHLLLMLGLVGAWTAAAAGLFFLGVTAAARPVGQPVLRAIGTLIVAVAASGFHALLAPSWSAAPQGAGGLLAIAGVNELTQRFGGAGTALCLAFVMAVGAVVAFDRWLAFIPAGIWAGLTSAAPWLARVPGALGGPGRALARAGRWVGSLFARAGREAPAYRADDLDDPDGAPARLRAEEAARSARRRGKPEVARDADDAGPSSELEPKPAGRKAAAVAAPAVVEEDEEALDDEPEAMEDADADDAAVDADTEQAEDEAEDEDAPGAPQVFDPDALRAKMAKLPVRFAAATRRAATEEDLAELQAMNADDSDYRFPGLDLLEEPDESYSGKLENFVRDQARALEEALKVYRIDGEVVGIDSGPVITLYEVRLAPGTKVSQITTIASDLARALKVVNVRIVPNTEGRDTVGVEAPNLHKEKVRLKELMTSEKTAAMRLPLFLGKDASGEPLIYDLAEMPHLLIAGTTGSGKSVAMNAVIVGFLYTKKPSDLKLALVDPKMVEMSQFRDIPHLMCPVITEMGKAAAILEWAVTKMDERYELLAEAGCRDIEAYNGLSWDEKKERLSATTPEEEARIPRKLPRMVFIIDELADLMMTNKEVETSIVRIAQKARAVGIHLILATQRPQANVVTGLIKSNMPARLCFKVASGMDSRIVMDQKGGELLLGQGDMLFLSPRSSKLTRSQGTLVEDREIRRVVRFMKEVAAPSFERALVQMGPQADGRDWTEHAQEDPLFDQAVEIVIETGRGSVSLLQRRLAIGYTRASRLIDLMGLAGIIGEHKGSVAREVMISPEEWEAMKEQARKDAEAGKGTLFAEPAAPGVDAAAPEAPADAEQDEEAWGEADEEEEEEADDDAEASASDEDEEEWEEDGEEYEDGEEGEDEDAADELDEGEEDGDDEEEADDADAEAPFDPTPRKR